MKTTAVIIIIYFLISGCTHDPESIVKSYEHAHNTHNIDKALTFFDDSISFEIKDTWIKKGKEKIKELELWDSTLKSNLKFDILKINNDTVLSRVIEKNDWFRAAGIDELIHDSTILIIRDNKITSIIASAKGDQYNKVGQLISSIFEWSHKTTDSTIYGLIKDGEFIYSPEAANKWLNLFKAIKKEK